MKSLRPAFALFLALMGLLAFAVAPSAAQKAVSTRTVTIVSEPKTSVWVDGIYYGKTGTDGRLVLRSISPGVKKLTLRADGFKEKIQVLSAAQKGDVKIAMAVTNDPGELKFQEAERLAFLDRDKAAAAYEEAIELRPAYVPAYIAYARVEIERDDYDNAQAILDRLKKISPRNAEAAAVEGRLLKDSGEPDKAIQAFKRAITYGRGVQPEAFAGLGLLFKERGESGEPGSDEQAADYTEAAKNLRTAVAQLGSAPDAPIILQLLGLTYERQRRYKEAIAIYEEFLKLFPDTPEAESVRSFIVQLRKQMSPQ